MYGKNSSLTSLVKLVREGIEQVRSDIKVPVAFQLRFLEEAKSKKFIEVFMRYMHRDSFKVDVSDSAIFVRFMKDRVTSHALLVPVNKYIAEITPMKGTNVFLIIVSGNYDIRKKLLSSLYKSGMRRGWLKQSFIKHLDELVRSYGLRFELLSFVYELRRYKGKLFRAAGTANFWPKGAESIGEAIEEYLLPIREARGYYIFIKSLRFRIIRGKEEYGTYSIDRWGKITIGPSSVPDLILELLPIVFEHIFRNYIEFSLVYNVREDKIKAYTTYYLEQANAIFLRALEPGPGFLDVVKLMVGKPTILEIDGTKLVVLPIEKGNPRLVSRIIDKANGMAVTLVATYSGIRLLPAPGSLKVDAEMIDHVLAIFRNLVSE